MTINKPREAFTLRQAATADTGQGETQIQNDYEILY